MAYDLQDLEKNRALDAIFDSFKPIRFDDWENLIEAPDFLIEDLIEKSSINMLYGPPKSCKSLLAIDLMVSLNNSDHWLGSIIPKPADVKYLAWEDPDAIFQRAFCVGKHKPKKTGKLRGNSEVSAPPPDIFGTYFEDALKHMFLNEDDDVEDQRPAVLIIDTLSLAAAGLGDENSSTYMGKVVDKLRRIRDLGITVIVVHHSGKDTTKGMRGHNSLLAAADNVFVFKKKANSNLITMKREACRNGPPGEVFDFEIKTEAFKSKKNDKEFLVPYLSHIKGFSDAKKENALTRPQILVLNSLQRLLKTDPTDVGMMFGLTDGHTAVSYALMEADCIQKNISPNAKSATSSKKAVRRALDKLVEYRLVIEKDGFIWPVTLEQTDTDKTGSSCNDGPRQCDTL